MGTVGRGSRLTTLHCSHNPVGAQRVGHGAPGVVVSPQCWVTSLMG